MLKKLITSLFVVIALLGVSPPLYNSVAEAGYFSGYGIDGEVDDSSVYHIGRNHIRVVFYIIVNMHTGAKFQDIAEVNWDGEPFVILSKSKELGYNADFERKLKINLIKYCGENY